MIQNSIPFEMRVLDFVNSEADAVTLAKETPINKVPLLVDGDQKIFDSRVIVNHLIQKHKLRSLTLDEENIVSTIYGCLDAGVVLFLMRRDGFDVSGPGFFLSRQRQRIPDGIHFVTPWALSLDPTNTSDWNYASMSLYAFLYWAEARELLKISDYPSMVTFMSRFADAPGVEATSF